MAAENKFVVTFILLFCLVANVKADSGDNNNTRDDLLEELLDKITSITAFMLDLNTTVNRIEHEMVEVTKQVQNISEAYNNENLAELKDQVRNITDIVKGMSIKIDVLATQPNDTDTTTTPSPSPTITSNSSPEPATNSTATNSITTTSTAANSTATTSTTTSSTATTNTAANSTSTTSTATNSTATTSTATNSTATNSTATNSTATNSTATTPTSTPPASTPPTSTSTASSQASGYNILLAIIVILVLCSLVYVAYQYRMKIRGWIMSKEQAVQQCISESGGEGTVVRGKNGKKKYHPLAQHPNDTVLHID